jgi:invasion protein IalB
MKIALLLALILIGVPAQSAERYGNWTFDCSIEAHMCFIALGRLPGTALMLARKHDGSLMLWVEAGDTRYQHGWLQVDQNPRITAVRCDFQNCLFSPEDAERLRDQLLQGGQSVAWYLHDPRAAAGNRLNANGFTGAILRLQRSAPPS